jgi:hypothetical protein
MFCADCLACFRESDDSFDICFTWSGNDHFIPASNSVTSGDCHTLDIYFSLIAGFLR